MEAKLALTAVVIALVASAFTLVDLTSPKATIVEIQALPEDGTAAAEECPATAPGGGWGNNKVSCSFSCEANDTIHIRVQSGDDDVWVYGKGQCGGATVSCEGTSSCKGSSRDVTRHADTGGKCNGNSDEVWKSALTVECFSTRNAACSPVTCFLAEGTLPQDSAQ